MRKALRAAIGQQAFRLREINTASSHLNQRETLHRVTNQPLGCSGYKARTANGTSGPSQRASHGADLMRRNKFWLILSLLWLVI
jgi:hypothetical protein